MIEFYDMHCHLGFCDDVEVAAADMHAAGLGGLCATVTPAEYRALVEGTATSSQRESDLRVGLGLHPWWVIEEAAVEELVGLAGKAQFIAEVGLDFSPKHEATKATQLAVFERVCRVAQGKVMSVHAVRSAGAVLDVLERAGLVGAQAAPGTAVIFHWFSGTSQELTRAICAGCYFSVNPRMLESKRGRAYVQAIPENRLLLESDLPAQQGQSYDAAQVRELLESAVARMAELRGCNAENLAATIAGTSRALLGM